MQDMLYATTLLTFSDAADELLTWEEEIWISGLLAYAQQHFSCNRLGSLPPELREWMEQEIRPRVVYIEEENTLFLVNSRHGRWLEVSLAGEEERWCVYLFVGQRIVWWTSDQGNMVQEG